MFKIECPHCGRRNVSEFRYGGQVQARPRDHGNDAAWMEYLYLRANPAGVQTEWWYHRIGCQRWFRLQRDTVSNQVSSSLGAKN